MAHEIVHSLWLMWTLGMIIKLELSKYFDKLSWNYMREVMNLTSSDFFSILLNGSTMENFNPPEATSKVIPFLPSYSF